MEGCEVRGLVVQGVWRGIRRRRGICKALKNICKECTEEEKS